MDSYQDVVYLLEEVGSVGISKEGEGVRHHPDVAPATVKIWFAPFAVLVGDAEDFVLETIRVLLRSVLSCRV